jgi:hypothetical protein
MVQLVWVCSIQDIRNSLNTFNKDAKQHKEHGRRLATQTTYWVYDSERESFGPNKFVAYKNMTYACYDSVLKYGYTGARHNGTKAKETIERVLRRRYKPNRQLHARLISWAISLFGPGVLGGVDEGKWRFIELPEG